jgi:DNA sulfur modification protein DndD
MKFTSIELLNWGPYESTGEIDLSSSSNYPLVIFYGENGRGKTSLFDAFWFVLYGTDGYDSRSKKFQTGSYANWFRLQENEEFPVKVILKYEIQSKKIKLIRGFSAVPIDIVKKTVKISDPYVHMTIDENPVSEGMIETNIRNELPREISDFFLFDSEKLDSMLNNLSADDSTSRQVIREGIEKILGVPSLKNLSKTLQENSLKIEKIARKSEQAHTQNRKSEEECERLDKLIQSADEDRENLEKNKTSLRAQIDEANEKLKNSEKIRQEIGRLEELEKGKAQKLSDLEQQINQLQMNFTNAWMLPIHNLIKKNLESFKEVNESKKKAQSEILKVKMQIENLDSQLKTQICSGCNRKIEINELEISNKITSLTEELNELHEKDKGIKTTNERIWNNLNKDGFYQLITENDREIRRLKHRLALDENDILDINNTLKTHDLSEIRLLSEEKDNFLKALAFTDVKLLENADTLNGLKLKKENEVKKIVQASNIDPSLKLTSDYLSTVIEVVEKTIPSFISSIRQKVESVVSANYVNLVKNEDVTGLEISEDYQVWVINKKIGRKRAVNFAQSFLYVYALIAGLIQVSGKDFPWIVDAPTSGLDPKNTHSLWEWLAKLDRQIIVLPHPGELSVETAQSVMGGRIAQQYKLTQTDVSQDASSQIEKVKI